MILMTESQAESLRSLTAGQASRLVSVHYGHGVYILGEGVLSDPAHAAHHDTLSALPTGDPLESARSAAIAAAAAERWQRCLTFTYDGVTAYADPAIAPLAAKIMALDEADSDDPVTFKLTAADWRSWTRTQLRAYGAAIDTHIQAAFDNEKALVDAILAASDREELNAVDLTSGWP
jgi:hypothetical protein